MGPAPTFQLNTTEFDKALKEILKASKRDFAVVINSRAWWFCRYAIQKTLKADRWAIEKQLLGKSVTRTKSGRVSRSKKANNYGADTFAAKIINSRRDPKIYGEELKAAILKMIGARNKSIGFIASGWGWAMDRLKLAWDQPEKTSGKVGKVKWFGEKKGGAIPARSLASNFFPYAIVVNSALIKEGKFTKQGDPHPIAIQGANKALQMSVDDMRKHLEEKFQKLAKKHNGRSL